jgi:hypothetical protein
VISPYLSRPLRTFAEAEQAIRAEFDRLGYVVVPKHPTAEMLEEGHHPALPGSPGSIYRAMINAAPQVTK